MPCAPVRSGCARASKAARGGETTAGSHPARSGSRAGGRRGLTRDQVHVLGPNRERHRVARRHGAREAAAGEQVRAQLAPRLQALERPASNCSRTQVHRCALGAISGSSILASRRG
jgi:hypothetical protein